MWWTSLIALNFVMPAFFLKISMRVFFAAGRIGPPELIGHGSGKSSCGQEECFNAGSSWHYFGVAQAQHGARGFREFVGDCLLVQRLTCTMHASILVLWPRYSSR